MISKLKAFLLFTLIFLTGIVSAQEISILNEEIELTVGDSVQLEAVYIDTAGAEIDTTVAWTVEPDSIGSISVSGYFTAENDGDGFIFAVLDTLMDSVSVVIEEEEEEPSSEYPAIEITNGDVELMVGDSVQFQVVHIDSGQVETDTTGTWSIVPDSLGTITETGLFFADLPGECIVNVSLDTLSDWVSVVITEEDEDDTTGTGEGNAFVVLPYDTVITIGTQIQYEAYYGTENGSAGDLVDTTLTWTLKGMPVGDLSEDGLFTATSPGFALVHAQFENSEGTAFVVVADSSFDSTGINTVTITRDSPNPNGYSVMQELTEGEMWTIGGLPRPMNILNGGGVYFPYGSLTEDVRIHISLPRFANTGGDSVDWGHAGVVGGVSFSVMVNDTLVEPYYFETPLIVGLVFKRGLLNNLGIDPYTLGLYFANEVGDSVVFDTTGIGYTTVDLDRNKIFSSVAHFSSLAIIGEEGSLVGIESEAVVAPKKFSLHQNYPNPFNPTTTIRYSLSEMTAVRIDIYNLLGQHIITLADQVQTPGMHSIIWNATDQADKPVSAGVYLYQIMVSDPDHFGVNNQSQTKKMILLK